MSNNEIGNSAVYDARELGKGKMFLLGFQHMFAMFGATVLVPLLTGLDVQTTLLMAGLGTILFHIFTKLQVPAFLGSSFAFLGGYTTVSGAFGDFGVKDSAHMLPYACLGVACAGLLYLVLALLIKLVGVKKVMKFFPPVVTGPIIIAIGLCLAPSALNNCATCWPLAVVALVIVIFFNIWGRGMAKIIPILLGVVGAYLFALIFGNGLGLLGEAGQVDVKAIADAAWIGLPVHMDETIFSIDWNNSSAIIFAITTMVPIAIATMMEHIGDISAISATVGENFIEDPGLHRTLIGDGIATSLSAMIGGPANTTYGENTGVLELSRVHDPKVVRLAAGYAIILSFIPKVAEIIASMPASIIGGVSFILYGMISAIGVRNVVENHVDFTKSRNLIIAGVILVSGLGFSNGLTFTIGSTSVTLTSLAIAAIAGIVLNAILPGNDYTFGKDPEGDASRGVDLRPHELEQELKNQK